VISIRRLVRRSYRFLLLAAAVALVAGAPLRIVATELAARTAQSDVQRVGLVVRYEDGDVETACVSFTEPEFTGADVIMRAGIDAGIANDGRVCSIDGVGCGTNDCWCQCNDFASCTYWAYYHLVNNTWQYSSIGASVHQVTDGTVEGWSWGKGDFVTAIEPPLYSFDQVCSVSGPEDENQSLTTSSLPTPPHPVSTPVAAPGTVVAGANFNAPVTLVQPELPGVSTAAADAPQPTGGEVVVIPTRSSIAVGSASTATPRPLTLLRTDGRPTPTPLLIARAGGAAPYQPERLPSRQEREEASSSAGSRTGASRSFEAALLPGYATFLFMVACLAVTAVWVLRRRIRPVKVDAGTGARRNSETQS
jgi:hypothetical protein